jgi:hypothetical protein
MCVHMHDAATSRRSSTASQIMSQSIISRAKSSAAAATVKEVLERTNLPTFLTLFNNAV